MNCPWLHKKLKVISIIQEVFRYARNCIQPIPWSSNVKSIIIADSRKSFQSTLTMANSHFLLLVIKATNLILFSLFLLFTFLFSSSDNLNNKFHLKYHLMILFHPFQLFAFSLHLPNTFLVTNSSHWIHKCISDVMVLEMNHENSFEFCWVLHVSCLIRVHFNLHWSLRISPWSFNCESISTSLLGA